MFKYKCNGCGEYAEEEYELFTDVPIKYACKQCSTLLYIMHSLEQMPEEEDNDQS